MDQVSLVKSDRVIEAQVLDALDRAHLPVTLCKWNYVPQLEEWQLIIATPWHDSKGSRTTWKALISALDRAGIYSRVPVRRVFLKSPGDPFVKLLQQEAKSEWDGFIHILRHTGNGYSSVFTPVAGADWAAVRRFSKLEDLKSFLLEDLGLSPASVQYALNEMSRAGTGEIYPVSLATRKMKKLGLGPASVVAPRSTVRQTRN